MNSNKWASVLAVGAVVFSGRTEALGSMISGGSISYERGCYCLQPTGSAFRPYEMWLYPTERFGGCKDVAYPKEKISGEIFKRLMACDELKTCLQLSEQLHCGSNQSNERCAQLDKDCFTRGEVVYAAVYGSELAHSSPVGDIKGAEARVNELRKKVDEACLGGRASSLSENCKKTRQELSQAQSWVEELKLSAIKTVRVLEASTEKLRKAADKVCSTSSRQKPDAKCAEVKESLSNAQKAFESVADTVKEEVYGCKRWYETPLECLNVTVEGAKLTMSEWGDRSSGIKPEIGTTGPVEKKSLKDKIHAAKQDALSGHLKDCKKTDGGFSCLNKEGQRYPVDYTVYKGWELARGKAVKPIEGKVAQKQEGQPAAKKEKKTGDVEGITDAVRSGFDLANRLKDDLRDTAKWPSPKLNPSNVKSYDPKLRAKYEEQMKLANAIKSNPSADPAELAKALNLKSDPIKNLGVSSLAKTGNGSMETAVIQGPPMVVVDQNGKPADIKVIKCDRSHGFVPVKKSGVLYCQQVPRASKTLAKMSDKSSVTGFKIVKQCLSGQAFKSTQWAGPGSGECASVKAAP